MEFVRVADVLDKMTVKAALTALGDNAPALTDTEIREIVRFLDNERRYQAGVKVAKATAATPPKPACPDVAQNLINLLAIHVGIDMKAARESVDRNIKRCGIPTFLVDQHGTIQKALTANNYNAHYNKLVHSTWHIQPDRDAPLMPVHILKEDYEAFMRPDAPEAERVEEPQPPSETSTQDAPEPTPRKTRKTDTGEDALLRNRIESILTAARKKWPDSANTPSKRAMSEWLAANNKDLNFKSGTIRKILNGTYPTLSRLGITGYS